MLRRKIERTLWRWHQDFAQTKRTGSDGRVQSGEFADSGMKTISFFHFLHFVSKSAFFRFTNAKNGGMIQP